VRECLEFEVVAAGIHFSSYMRADYQIPPQHECVLELDSAKDHK